MTKLDNQASLLKNNTNNTHNNNKTPNKPTPTPTSTSATNPTNSINTPQFNLSTEPKPPNTPSTHFLGPQELKILSSCKDIKILSSILEISIRE